MAGFPKNITKSINSSRRGPKINNKYNVVHANSVKSVNSTVTCAGAKVNVEYYVIRDPTTCKARFHNTEHAMYKSDWMTNSEHQSIVKVQGRIRWEWDQ